MASVARNDGTEPERTPKDASPAVADALQVLRTTVISHAATEDRPSQRHMTELVARAIESGEPLIVQAGTGTGKSLAYLAGALGAQARVVVSTATRQLSDQLLDCDVPLVSAAVDGAFGRKVSASVLKGRSNYLCLAKLDELNRLEDRAQEHIAQDSLDLGIPVAETATSQAQHRPTSADMIALKELVEWAASGPEFGDRAGGPAVPEHVWQQVSTTAAACPSARKCAFGEDCYAELARDQARGSDIVVANHALLAADLVSPNPIFSDRDAIVIDEVHELVDYLSSAWGAEVHTGTLERVARDVARVLGRDSPEFDKLGQSIVGDTSATLAGLAEVPDQRWPGEFPAYLDGPLRSLALHLTRAAKELDARLKEMAGVNGNSSRLQILRTQVVDVIDAIEMVRRPKDQVVRWSAFERETESAVLRAAPLEVGAKFADLLGERALVATSATAAVAGDFAATARMLGVADRAWHGEDVGSPFDFANQGILYVPTDIPEPVGKDRVEHTQAVLDVLTELTLAAGGRTLALFTTTNAARNAAAHLRNQTSLTVLEVGELSAADLAAEFAADETSVLCATMGMWSGLNIVGRACTLVVIDKIPFAPMNDPLCSARRAHIDDAGGDGFGEVFVNDASLKLTQGVGRLIRSKTDRGVVAILDPRLRTRRYGKLMLASLPPMWRADDRGVVVSALRRLAAND